MHGIKKQEMSVWNDINYFEISGVKIKDNGTISCEQVLI